MPRSAGQFAIPFALDPSIILTSTGVLNPMRNLGQVETIVGATTWKGVASDGVVAAFGAEGAARNRRRPDARAAVDHGRRRRSASCRSRSKPAQDWDGLQDELVRLMNDAKNVLEATKFLLGTGTNEPGGILNIGGTGGLTTTQRVQTAARRPTPSATRGSSRPRSRRASSPPPRTPPAPRSGTRPTDSSRRARRPSRGSSPTATGAATSSARPRTNSPRS